MSSKNEINVTNAGVYFSVISHTQLLFLPSMKQVLSLLFLSALILCGCDGSKTYRGLWKAVDSEGKKFEIYFESESLAIKDSSGKSKHYNYTQISAAIDNGVVTYGIELNDSRVYLINFPNSKDKSVAIIKDENGNPIYTISRTGYLKNTDIYKLD